MGKRGGVPSGNRTSGNIEDLQSQARVRGVVILFSAYIIKRDRVLFRVAPEMVLKKATRKMSFIVVRYGANSEILLNPNCPIPILLSYLRAQLGLPRDAVIDLATETGEVCDLWAASKQKDYAIKWVSSGTWVGVKVGFEDGEDSPHYTSLLDMSGEKIKFSARRSTKPSRPQRPSVSDDTASVSSINTATTQSGRRSNLSKSKTGSQASLTGKKKSKK